jgi:streptomycin 6-kinase
VRPQLTENLRAAVTAEPAMRGWLEGLPTAIAEVSTRWGLSVGAPYEPGGRTAWVAPVRTADGPAALKIRWRHFEAEHEAAGLRAWDGAGTIRLLAEQPLDDQTDALLLEACEPGTSAATLPGEDQDALVAALLRRLWIAPPAGAPFRPLAALCSAWAAAVDADRAAAVIGDAALVRAGLDLFVGLGAERVDSPVLLLTDLHAANVLAAAREPWLAVDPKPYVGDPTYDLVQHLLNHADRVLADPRRVIRRLARRAGVDAPRLTRWLLARCAIDCVDRPELGPIARRLGRET